MTNQPIRATQIQVPNGELQIDAYLAEPTAEGQFPGIVVIQEIFGVNSHIRDVTERIAKEGYIAIAPAIYQRQVSGFEIGYTPADMTLGRTYKAKTTAPELLSDIQATLNYLKTLPNLNPKFGAIGFCFGGHVVYLAATLPDIQATACFYGGEIATMTPGGGAPTLTRTKDIKGVLYGFFGTEDPLIPNEQVDQIETALQDYQIPHKIFRYQADHGFFCDQRSTYNAEAAQDSWMQVKELFDQQLRA
ncbi:dienelactone hydrolase family protein [Planktothrix sp. FACHB-1365]|uniref:dienelactone hydrolase family protein n=1 Tax=Planktothrix sp. FACHB-1365 TaxID=2692855 RepID=UPI00168947D3|nr:dienelactone hydrolase family protein [Planktothrix sp. FACHB-1365]MBD2483089.1 dienelactone hydrolase family protein [Planktothrix sp. FACHB-1365]